MMTRGSKHKAAIKSKRKAVIGTVNKGNRAIRKSVVQKKSIRLANRKNVVKKNAMANPKNRFPRQGKSAPGINRNTGVTRSTSSGGDRSSRSTSYLKTRQTVLETARNTACNTAQYVSSKAARRLSTRSKSVSRCNSLPDEFPKHIRLHATNVSLSETSIPQLGVLEVPQPSISIYEAFVADLFESLTAKYRGQRIPAGYFEHVMFETWRALGESELHELRVVMKRDFIRFRVQLDRYYEQVENKEREVNDRRDRKRERKGIFDKMVRRSNRK